MKKKLYLLVFCILAIGVLCFRGIYQNIRQGERTQDNQVIQIKEAEQDGITKAQMARMVSLLYYTKEEIISLKPVISYKDIHEKEWYYSYVNGLYSLGFAMDDIERKESKFHPLDYVTFGQCEDLVKRICIQMEQDSDKKSKDIYDEITGKLSYQLEEQKGNTQISQQQWMELYLLLVKEIPDSNVREEKLFVIGTPDTMKKLSQKQVVTDKGEYHFEQEDLTKYLDKTVRVYTKDKEVVFVKKALEEKTILENVYFIRGSKKNLDVFINGYQRTFVLENPLAKDMEQVVGDITVEKGQIIKISIKPEVINDKVLVANDKYIELEKYGKLKLASNYKIYRVYDELMMELTNGILVGYNATDFVVAEGKICAALITNRIKAKNIRVLIKTNGYQGYYHKNVVLKANKNVVIYYGKQEKKVPAGKKITIKPNSKFLSKGRLRIKTQGEGKVSLLSVKRSSGVPSYRGTMEVIKNPDGLTLVNELSMEEYLYGVIPSEMPTSYGLEALKVQAVCARSYAYRQLMANSCGAYGAHVDDSVSYQVYNNIPENESSILAVKDTYGKVMEYEGDIITAYYFSTSCGHTASSNQVWFSSEEVPYLSGDLQKKKGETALKEGIDLTKEKNFRKFITKNLCKTYDSQFPWYRWKTTISLEDLRKTIEANLGSRYEANPNLIEVLDKNGEYRNSPVNSIGTIKNIKVGKRQEGGIVTELIVEGTKGTIKIKTEYNIRVLLSPLYDNVIRQDRSIVNGLSMLPSAFFVIDPVKKDGKTTGYQLTGGGYGHGVGMSQNGVKAMTDEKIDYEEILKHYYKGVKIGFIY